MRRGKKKVLFIFNATTHYYNLVLNKLNENTDYEIHLMVPKERIHNVGPGVHQTIDNLKIPIYTVKEKVGRYIGSYFPELFKILWKVKPDIIVTLEPYQKGIFLNPFVFATIKLLSIKIILKNIPFRMPLYTPYKEFFKDELRKRNRGFLNSLRAIKWSMISYRKFFEDKILYSKGYDGHVCYVEKAYDIYSTYGVKKEAIFMTYNSPDTDMLLRINDKVKKEAEILPENPRRLIHVGRLVDWKRVDLILEAIVKLNSDFSNVEFLVLGNGPKKEEWEQYARVLGLENQVKFLGGIYDLELLGKYLRASSIYVLGGMGGLSINDAMCFERPILCSECDGTEVKLVKDGFNGYFFENGNSEDLARKIAMIWNDEHLQIQMGRNSRRIIENDVNINKVLEGYTGAFEYVQGLKTSKSTELSSI
ncbi:MAG: glycosyltransferase [Bdellovibrionales bacterium]|nr:glycosyltransferase [Bdellovibrionales bacterium]